MAPRLGEIKQKKCIYLFIAEPQDQMISFVLFPPSLADEVWILIYQNWSIVTTFSRTGLLFALPFTVLFPSKTKAPLHPISASISFPESALPLSSGWQPFGKWNSKFALNSFLKSTGLLKLFDTSMEVAHFLSSGYAWGSCTHSGAHNPERATSMYSCHSVFTNQFIFRTVLVRNFNIF